jgi:hypothetical protein
VGLYFLPQPGAFSRVGGHEIEIDERTQGYAQEMQAGNRNDQAHVPAGTSRRTTDAVQMVNGHDDILL